MGGGVSLHGRNSPRDRGLLKVTSCVQLTGLHESRRGEGEMEEMEGGGGEVSEAVVPAILTKSPP